MAKPLLIRLMSQFYGHVFSFDEGLDLGDKHLSSSLVKYGSPNAACCFLVHISTSEKKITLNKLFLVGTFYRNLLSYGYYDFMIIEHLIYYIYTELKRLEQTSDFDVIKGNFRFKEIGIPKWHESNLMPNK